MTYTPLLPATAGGTGLTSPGSSGNVLTSNGTIWTSAAPSGGGGGTLNPVRSADLGPSGLNTRALVTTYQNTTGVAIWVQVNGLMASGSGAIEAYVDSVAAPTTRVFGQSGISPDFYSYTVSFYVPAGSYYRVPATTGTTIQEWFEYQLLGNAALANATANGIYQAPSTALNTAWTNLEAGLGSPSWFAAAATQPKRTQFMRAVGTTTAFNRALFDENVISTPSGTYPGGVAFVGGVLLPDGRVFCVPHNSTTARIYDPVTNTLTTPAGAYPGGAAFIGGALLSDGRVFCVPYNSTTARIYDPATDTLTTPSGAYPGSGAFQGGVLLPDGRVFCVPHNSTTARIYDPATDTLSTPAGTYPGSGAIDGGVLLPDGRVFCVPSNSTTARIYDPATNTLTTPSGTYPGAAAFAGGVLLPDGRVFCVPVNSTTARIYDPATDTLTTPSGAYPGSGAFQGGVLLPDGRVFCVPFSATTSRIYDPVTDTLSTPAGTYPGSGAFDGGVLLSDGRVFCVPLNATTARIYTSRSVAMPSTITLSAFFNKL